MRKFEFEEGASRKFWNIALSGKSFTVNFGKIGTTGQTQVKDFADEAAAKKEHDKLVAEKLKKGYRETTPAGAAPTPAPAPAAAAPAKSKSKSKPAETPAPAPAAAVAAPAAEAAKPSAARTFEYSDATSHKFWNIEMSGNSFTVSYGRIGSTGQTQVKDFSDPEKARKEYDKQVAEKLKKGYRETTPSARAAPASLRESLEQALEENPEELANHMAYADYLTEQGDPLGDFIRVQLALEDPSRPEAERKKLQQQEKDLLDKHARTWLGDLATFLLDQKPEKDRTWSDLKADFTFRRGWLHSLKVERFSLAFTRALAGETAVRLLQHLHLDNEAYEPEGEYDPGVDVPEDSPCPQLYPLARSTSLANVRTFIIGEEVTEEYDNSAMDGGFNSQTYGEAVVGVVKQMPKLEELHLCARGADTEQLFSLKTLHNLRVLRVYHSDSYPLSRLAKNPSLGKLTHLLLHPHAMQDEDPYIREPGVKLLVNSPELKSLTHLQIRLCDMGDKGVKTIIDSGILKRLKVLDLRHGCITDKGARLFADCPDLKNLELLDLTHNNMTDAGIAALKATGVKVVADHQWNASTPGEFDAGDQEYLFAGDIE